MIKLKVPLGLQHIFRDQESPKKQGAILLTDPSSPLQ